MCACGQKKLDNIRNVNSKRMTREREREWTHTKSENFSVRVLDKRIGRLDMYRRGVSMEREGEGEA